MTPFGLALVAGALVACAAFGAKCSILSCVDVSYTGNPSSATPIINIASPIIIIATPILNIAPRIINIAPPRSFNTFTIVVAYALALLRSPATSYAPGRTLLLVLLLVRGADAQCSGSTYSYGSGACASCAFGATFISSIAGCAPSATLTAGPTDTAFYLSGSVYEGVAAFSTVNAPAGVSYAADAFGKAGGALVLASGSYLAADGATAPEYLPTGNVAWSLSAWVKCQAPVNNVYAAALEWGAPEGALQLTAALAVGSYAIAGDRVVTTLAGGNQGYADGTGTQASFFFPFGVAVTSSGVIVVGDSDRIRLVTPFDEVTTLAGSIRGYADGTGTQASFFSVAGVAVTSSGVIVVADGSNNRIRLVTPLGVVTTLAGSSPGYADGTGTNARFSSPHGVAVFSSGVIVVADSQNDRIRLVTLLGVVTTLAGSSIRGYADGTNARFSYPYGVGVTSSGVIVVADFNNNRIRLVTPLGIVTTLAGSITGYADGTGTNALFDYPIGVAVTSSGVIVMADYQNNRI